MLKIKEIREKKNITQDEISLLSGIKKSTYLNYENEKTDIPLSKLQNIATALNVSLYELIEDDANKNVVSEPKTAYEAGGNIILLLEQVELLKQKSAMQVEIIELKEEKIKMLTNKLQHVTEELKNCMRLKNISETSK